MFMLDCLNWNLFDFVHFDGNVNVDGYGNENEFIFFTAVWQKYQFNNSLSVKFYDVCMAHVDFVLQILNLLNVLFSVFCLVLLAIMKASSQTESTVSRIYTARRINVYISVLICLVLYIMMWNILSRLLMCYNSFRDSSY